LRFVLLPQDEERKRKKELKQAKKQKKLEKKGKKPLEKEKISFSEMFKEKGISGFLEDIKVIVKSLWSLISAVLKRAVIKKLDFKMNVASEDAANTAITYGYANAVIYPIVSAFMENVSECDEHNVEITPDFSEEGEPSVSFCIHLYIKPAKLLGALLENRANAEKLLTALNQNSKDKKEK